MSHRRFWRMLAENPHQPNAAVAGLSDVYCAEMDFPPIQPTPYGKPEASVEKKLADLFENTPDQSGDRRVQDAYGEMVYEIDRQYKLMPVQVVPFDDEWSPYVNSKEMLDDVINNKRMYVYDGGEDHSLLTRRENFKFRAVHDFYGHGRGFEFGPRGEFAAFEAHAKMFSPRARHALTSETRAQQAFSHYGPFAHIPLKDRPYAPQKAIWIPLEFCTTPALQRAYADYPSFFPRPTAANRGRKY